MKNLFDVKGKIFVITGGTGILGRAMVRHFTEQGASVVILGLDMLLELGDTHLWNFIQNKVG